MPSRRSDGSRDNNYYRRQALETLNTKAQLNRVYLRDDGICQLCKLPCTREDASRDHIKDIVLCTREEAINDSNIQLAHTWCNNAKSNSSPGKQPKQYGPTDLTYKLADVFPELANIFPNESD